MSSGNSFWHDHLPQVGSLLLSPVAGVIAAYVFATEECATVPGGEVGGFRYGPEQLCTTQPNEEAGAIIGLIVLVLAGVWLAITVYMENQQAKPTA